MLRLFASSVLLLPVLLSLGSGAAEAAPAAAVPIRIAVQSDVSGGVQSALVAQSENQLLYSLQHLPLVIERMPFSRIQTLAEGRKIDFALTEADGYAVLERFFGARSLISQKIRESNSVDSSAAVLAVTLDQPDAPKSLDDIGSRTVLAADKNELLGKIFRREMIHSGRRDYRLESIEKRAGGDRTLDVLSALRSRPSAVGLIPACFYERHVEAHPEWFEGLRFLTSERIADAACRNSSPFYPGWTLSSFSHTNELMSRTVSGALLGMPATALGEEWATGAHYSGMHELLETIGEDNYRRQTQFNWTHFYVEYRPWFLFAALFLLTLIVHSFRTEVLVRRRTEELLKTIREKEAIERDVKLYNERLSAFERVGLVGELSSMLAHELKQPLAVIRNYARGLSRTLAHDDVNVELIKAVISKIDTQSTKASDIIDHVRGFAKRRHDILPICLSDILSNAVEKFQASRSTLTVVTRVEENVWIEADALEIELVINNLLKNASDALSETPDAKIEVSLEASDGQAALCVTDNGPKLTDEQFAALTIPLNSSKPQGLGLGLVIVRRIVESARGSLTFTRLAERGLSIRAAFPAYKKEK